MSHPMYSTWLKFVLHAKQSRRFWLETQGKPISAGHQNPIVVLAHPPKDQTLTTADKGMLKAIMKYERT